MVDIGSIDVRAGGNLPVYVHTSEDDGLQPDRRVYGRYVRVMGRSMTVEIPNISYGTCAVSVIQDLNGNRKIDTDWFPIPGPAESAAVSNNASAIVGASSFEDARFRLCQPRRTVSIALDD